MNFYLLITWHDVQPELESPFETDKARLAHAREVRMESDERGVYRLHAASDAEGAPFSGGEIED